MPPFIVNPCVENHMLALGQVGNAYATSTATNPGVDPVISSSPDAYLGCRVFDPMEMGGGGGGSATSVSQTVSLRVPRAAVHDPLENPLLRGLHLLLGGELFPNVTVDFAISAVGGPAVVRSKQQVQADEKNARLQEHIKDLKSKHPDLRADAAEALGKIGDRQATKHLIEALEDGDERVERSIINALGKIADPLAARPLIRILDCDDYYFDEEIREALVQIGAPAVAPLIQVLNNQALDDGIRDRAAYALGQICDPSAVTDLIWALNDVSKDVRNSAAIALADIGDPRAIEPLTRAIKSGKIGGIPGVNIGYMYLDVEEFVIRGRKG